MDKVLNYNMFVHYLPIAAIHCDLGAFRQQHNIGWSMFLSTFVGGVKHRGGLDCPDALPTNDGIGSWDFVFIIR